VTEIDYDEIPSGEKKDKKELENKEPPKQKECPQCHFLKPANTTICPSCGYEAKIVNKTHEKDGELVELKKDAPKKSADNFPDRREAYAMLLWYAMNKTKNKKPGFAYHMFHRLFGSYPSYGNVTPVETNDNMKRWIVHNNIRSAKSKWRKVA
jgi:hypothetical protein